MLEETLVFVDGENLSVRYKEMVSSGRIPRPDNVIVGESFVWTNRIFLKHSWNIKRVSYYTSLSGDDDAVRALRQAISSTSYQCNTGTMTRTSQLVPFVRKKSSRSRKESICDIAIAVDVMRACYRDHAPTIWILSGDGDFVQLFEEVLHSGKTAYASAFSSGLNEEIPLVVDEFICLDDLFFEPKTSTADQSNAPTNSNPNPTVNTDAAR